MDTDYTGADIFGSSPSDDDGRLVDANVLTSSAKPAPIKEEKRPVTDWFASTGAGALKGVASIPGMVGDLPQLSQAIDAGMAKYGEKAANYLDRRFREEFNMEQPSPEDLQKRHKAYSDVADVLMLPTNLAAKYTAPFTTENLVKQGEDLTGYDLYKPKTDIGRYLRAGAEFVPGMFVGSGGFTNMGRKALTGFVSGVGSEAAGTVTKGTPYETAAGILGAIVPGVGIDTGMGILNTRYFDRPENVQNTAANVVQERVAQPSAVADAIEAARNRNYIPGLFPTSAQMARSPQLGTLERDVTAQNGLNANAGDISLQREANKDAFGSAADAAARAGAVTMPPGQDFGWRADPQNASSRDAFSKLDSKWKDADAAQNANWTVLDNMGASLNKGRMVAGIEDHLNSLSRTHRSEIPAGYKTLLDDIETSYGPQVPIRELQDYRSKILQEARDTNVPGNKRVLNEFAEKIRVLMEDKNNYTLNGGHPLGQGDEAAQWTKAVNGTREYHQKWDPVDNMLGVTGNEWKAAPEAAMSKILSGQNSGQNIRNLRVTGVDINPHIEEYMIGQLTKNGNKTFVTADEINEFRTNPKNATIISEVPSIDGRLNQLAYRANNTSAAKIAHLLNKKFVDAAGTGDPGKIADFISANKQGLQSSGSSQYLDALENSANVLRPFQAGQVASRDVYELLKKGDIATILFGKNMSRAVNVGAGAIAGTVAAKVPFFSGLAEFLPGMGALAGTGDKLTRGVSSLIFGATAEETTRVLEEAMRDPKVMELLLRRPTPENVNLVMSLVKSMARPAAISSMQAARPEPVLPLVRPTNAHGGRTRYADGGLPFTGGVSEAPMRPYDLQDPNDSPVGPQAKSRSVGVSTKPVEIAPGVFVSGGIQSHNVEGPGVRGKASGYNAQVVAPNLLGVDRLTGNVGLDTTGGKSVRGGLTYGGNDENISLNASRMKPEYGESQNQIMARYSKKFASGGRAKKTVEADAAALMNAAAKAKKQIDSRTENILNLPDESVVKALRAARATGGRA